MVYVIGIDIGSAFSKGILMCDQKIVESYVMTLRRKLYTHCWKG